jgi:hypothetical protein
MKTAQARHFLECWCLRNGYVRNRHGKFEKTVRRGVLTGGQPGQVVKETRYRYSINTCAMRLEVYVPTIKEWRRLRSGYIKNITITGDDKLGGLTSRGC